MQLRTVAAGLALALPLVTGACVESDRLVSPVTRPENALFARYVAMGNSLTAGVQSAGINDSTQRRSYAALIGRASGFPYYYASLQGRGCAPPFVNNITQERVGGGGPATCDLRAPDHHPWLSNVAVPTARVVDAVDNLLPVSNSNALTTIILGGRTQLQAMQDADPTLVTVWLGANDFGGALFNTSAPGDITRLTSVPDFEDAYGQVLDAIEAEGAEVVLINLPDPRAIPFTASGATYWCLKTGLCPGIPAAPFPANFLVDVSCAPVGAVPTSDGENVRVPWSTGIVRLLTAAQDPLTDYTLDCTVDAEVITPTEFAAINAAYAGYNAYITAQAAARGMVLVDVNPAFLGALAANDGRIHPFPDVSAVPTGGSVNFGSWFSLDGIHPSSEGQGAVADLVATAINANFGTSIAVPVPR